MMEGVYSADTGLNVLLNLAKLSAGKTSEARFHTLFSRLGPDSKPFERGSPGAGTPPFQLQILKKSCLPEEYGSQGNLVGLHSITSHRGVLGPDVLKGKLGELVQVVVDLTDQRFLGFHSRINTK